MSEDLRFHKMTSGIESVVIRKLDVLNHKASASSSILLIKQNKNKHALGKVYKQQEGKCLFSCIQGKIPLHHREG